jgi:hypothetical protein
MFVHKIEVHYMDGRAERKKERLVFRKSDI